MDLLRKLVNIIGRVTIAVIDFLRKVVKVILPKKLFRYFDPIGHWFEAMVAATWYGYPSRKMHVIGVTGTDGKTTTTFLIEKMLTEAGFKVGMLSTVAFGIGDNIQSQIEHMTTEQALVLQKRLREFKRAGVEWLVMEVSSHSLAQHRTWSVPYEIAVITNVTGDHLDYHGTFKRYLQAKLRLFKIANKHGRRFGVVNGDDPNAKQFKDVILNSVTYGVKSGQLRAENIKQLVDHSEFTAKIGDDSYEIRINIPGDFNISNALAAVAVGREIGLSKDKIEKGIAALSGVEGRMSVVDEGQKFKVIVDFASTPQSFEKLFSNIRPLTKGKLIAVFGSAGRRDESKRAVQGEIAGRFADEVVLTEEDDRDVDGKVILQQIAEGSVKAGKVVGRDLFMVLDREQAIKFALERAKNADDTVVLLGKGHEKTIERADGKHPWNEIEVTRRLIKSLN